MTAEATGDKVIEDADAGDTGNEAGEEDRRTGYYIAGHDWPAIRNSIALSEIYDALNRINDAAVKGALRDVAGQSKPA